MRKENALTEMKADFEMSAQVGISKYVDDFSFKLKYSLVFSHNIIQHHFVEGNRFLNR